MVKNYYVKKLFAVLNGSFNNFVQTSLSIKYVSRERAENG